MVAPSGPSTTIPVPGPNRDFYIDTGLMPNTSYLYTVRAVNVEGNSDDSNQDGATTDAEPVGCKDDGNHDNISTKLWNIRRVKAHRNPKWQATKQTGCELSTWLFVLDTGVDDAHPDLNVLGSIDFTGETCAPVPQRKASSATYSSVRLTLRSTTSR